LTEKKKTLKTKIIGTGSYLPEKILNNQELEKIVDTTDEWITTRCGIKERRIVENGVGSSFLATQAAQRALQMAGVSPQDLGMIIVGTVTPDMLFPSTACLLQHNLKAKKAAAFDLSAGCSGFIYGLSVADSFIRNRSCKYILLVGVECLSKITDYQDRTTCVLFGDGAGAVVLTGTTGERGILSTHLYSDGSYGDLLCQPGGGSRQPATHESIDKRLHYLKMDGNKVYKIAVNALEDVVIEALAHNKLKSEQINLLIAHQANLRIIQAVAARLHLPDEKVYLNIQKYGNTSSASIPIALDEANRQGMIKEKDILLFNAFGAGFTWGAAVVRW
jgi:3-oxoacyl-[acyl-carrier-protein] synthase-3